MLLVNSSGELRRWVDCSDFMAEPSDVAVHDRELYICDFKVRVAVISLLTGTHAYLCKIGTKICHLSRAIV